MRHAKLALEEFAAAQEARRAQQEEEHRAAEIKRRMQAGRGTGVSFVAELVERMAEGHGSSF